MRVGCGASLRLTCLLWSCLDLSCLISCRKTRRAQYRPALYVCISNGLFSVAPCDMMLYDRALLTFPPLPEHETTTKSYTAGAQAGRRGRRGRAGAVLPPAAVHHEAGDRHQARRRRHGSVRLLARGAEQRLCPCPRCHHGDGISGGVQGRPAGTRVFYSHYCSSCFSLVCGRIG